MTHRIPARGRKLEGVILEFLTLSRLVGGNLHIGHFIARSDDDAHWTVGGGGDGGHGNATVVDARSYWNFHTYAHQCTTLARTHLICPHISTHFVYQILTTRTALGHLDLVDVEMDDGSVFFLLLFPSGTGLWNLRFYLTWTHHGEGILVFGKGCCVDWLKSQTAMIEIGMC